MLELSDFILMLRAMYVLQRLATDHKNEMMAEPNNARTYMVFELMEALSQASVGHVHTKDVHLPTMLLRYEHEFCEEGRYTRMWDSTQTSDKHILEYFESMRCRPWDFSKS